jgi:hypothetical protein
MRSLWSSSVRTHILPRLACPDSRCPLPPRVEALSVPFTPTPSSHLRPVFQCRGCLTGATSSRVRHGRYTIATAKSTNISFVTTASRGCLRDRKSPRSQEVCGDDMESVWHPSVERTYSPPRILLLLTANSSRLSLPAFVSPLVFLHRSLYHHGIPSRHRFPGARAYVRIHSPRCAGRASSPSDDESFQALVPRFLRAVLPSTSYTLPCINPRNSFTAPRAVIRRSSLIPPLPSRPSTPTSSLHSFR